MALSLFPTLPGLAYPVVKTPTTSTRALTGASGVEYRAQNWSYPRWKFSLPIEFLRQFASYTEWTTLVGFILSQAGMFGNFTYNDPTDNVSPAGQPVGAGTGAQTQFPLVRTIGGFTEPILYCNTLTSVYLNGSLQSTSTYSLVQTGSYGPDTIQFNTAPSAGVSVTATFYFYYVCRFLQDDPDFENFMAANSGGQRWNIQKLDFFSVK
jgi:uncharacterized protein (TIGR02217 family)